MKCSDCLREAEDGSFLCCSSCPQGLHSADCNKRTYPGIPNAQYYDDAQASIHLMMRLQKALSLSHVLKNELLEISNAAIHFIPNYQDSALDALVRHLQIDISYTEREARKLLGR